MVDVSSLLYRLFIYVCLMSLDYVFTLYSTLLKKKKGMNMIQSETDGNNDCMAGYEITWLIKVSLSHYDDKV